MNWDRSKDAKKLDGDSQKRGIKEPKTKLDADLNEEIIKNGERKGGRNLPYQGRIRMHATIPQTY